MNSSVNRWRRVAAMAGVVTLAMVAAACGDDDGAADTTPATEAPAGTEAPSGTEATSGTEAPGGGEVELASGDVFVTGSSTVEPISTKVGELANDLSGGDLAVTVEGPGTGDGFKKFCAGEADVSDASRRIKDEEAATCAENGVEFVEIEIAIDGLTVATNPDNSAVECLDVPALYALLGPESEGVVSSWADANDLAAEVGSAYTDLPDASLDVYGPGEESGTYDSFVEFAIKGLAEERGQDAFVRADYSASPNDNLIVEGIEGSDTSLGWVGYAYYAAEEGRMKAIAIAGDDGTCVEPTTETIADGSYPFSRTLYIYVNTQKAADNPAVASFVDLYLSEQGLAEVAEAGYVDLPAERITASQEAWAAARG